MSFMGSSVPDLLATFASADSSAEAKYSAALWISENSDKVPLKTFLSAKNYLATNAPKATVKIVEKTEVSYSDLYKLEKKALLKVLGASGDDGSAEAWFVYFWQEMKLAATQYQAEMEKMVKELFTLDTQKKLTPKIPLSQYAEQNPAKYLAYLDFMLKKSFRPYPASKDLLSADEDNILQAVKSAKEVVHVPYTWRADDRPFEQVKASQGFQTKADSLGYARKMNITKPWHPYSLSGNSKYFWFRLGQGDNCLYTVVSVGIHSDFRAVLPFPKIEGRVFPPKLFPDMPAHKKLWDADDVDITDRNTEYFQRKKLMFAKCNDGKYLLLPASETWLYLFLLGGVVLLTNELQTASKYPEVGAKEVKLRNIYGAIRFVRFFHGPNDSDGFTVVVDKRNVKLVAGDEELEIVRTKRFGNSEAKLKEIFEAATTMRPTGIRWTAAGNGFQEIDASYQYCGRTIEIAELADRPPRISEFGFPT